MEQHPFNDPLSMTTKVSQYQKDKTNLDLLKQETMTGSGQSWAISKTAPQPRQLTRPAPSTQFFTDRMLFLPPKQQHQSNGN